MQKMTEVTAVVCGSSNGSSASSKGMQSLPLTCPAAPYALTSLIECYGRGGPANEG